MSLGLAWVSAEQMRRRRTPLLFGFMFRNINDIINEPRYGADDRKAKDALVGDFALPFYTPLNNVPPSLNLRKLNDGKPRISQCNVVNVDWSGGSGNIEGEPSSICPVSANAQSPIDEFISITRVENNKGG